MIAFGRVTDALQGRGHQVRETGTGRAMAQCPAHDDGNPSLNITAIEGSVLLYCHAGCDTDAVLSALDLAKRDLYDDPAGQCYEYSDGRRVKRNPDNKNFPQSGNTKGRALFHVELLGDATTVYVTEGEKDVLAIESAGGAAVCSAMGAGKGKYGDWTPLRGRHVVIVADRDEPGRKHAAQVAEYVAPLAQSVSIVESAVGKDAADHIAAGRSLDEFVSQSDVLLADLRDGAWLDAQTFPPLEYAVPRVIPEGCGLLVGPPKVGKSWLVGDIGLAVAAGGKALGCLPVNKRPVLYLALEDGYRRLQSRFRHLMGDDQPIPSDITVAIKVSPAEAIPKITAFLTKHAREKPLVILDTLGKVRPPKRAGEDSYQLDYAVGGALKAAVDAVPGASLLIVHHTRKAESPDFVDSVSGTQGIAGSVDFVIVLKRKRQSDEAVLAVTGRDVPEAEYALRAVGGVLWRLDGRDLAAAARTAQTRDEAAGLGDRATDVLGLVNAQGEEHTRAVDVTQTLGIEAKRAAEVLARLVDSCRIRRVSRGVYGPLHVPTSADCADSADLAGQDTISFPPSDADSADSADLRSEPTGSKSALDPQIRTCADRGADLKTPVDQPNPHYPHNPHYPDCRVCGRPVTTGVGDIHLGCREGTMP